MNKGMNKYATLLRRELWEYKSSFIVLPFTATIFIFALLSIAYLRFSPETNSSTNVSSITTAIVPPIQKTTIITSSTPNSSTTTTISSTPSSINTTTSTSSSTSTSTAVSTSITDNTSENDQPVIRENTSADQSLEDQFNAFSTNTSNHFLPGNTLNPFKSRSSFLAFSIFILNLALSFLIFVAALNYAHRALFEDRKSREILFWRSMPVSESQNVAAKLFVLFGLAPAIILILSLLAGLSCWLLASLAGANESEVNLRPLANQFRFYETLMLTMLAFSPIICWTLFSSAFAKKSPFMVSTILPIGLILADRIFAWATGINLHIRDTIHAFGAFLLQFIRNREDIVNSAFSGSFLLVIATSGALIVATIWLRNNRYEN